MFVERDVKPFVNMSYMEARVQYPSQVTAFEKFLEKAKGVVAPTYDKTVLLFKDYHIIERAYEFAYEIVFKTVYKRVVHHTNESVKVQVKIMGKLGVPENSAEEVAEWFVLIARIIMCWHLLAYAFAALKFVVKVTFFFIMLPFNLLLAPSRIVRWVIFRMFGLSTNRKAPKAKVE